MPRGRRPFALATAEPIQSPGADDARESAAAPVVAPERARLSDAIAAYTALQQQMAETSVAIDTARDERDAAQQALYAAEEALERAKPRPSSGFEPYRPPGAFWGSQPQYASLAIAEAEPPVSIAAARDAVAVATDARDTGDRAVQYHTDRLKQLETSLHFKANAVKNAVRDVLRAAPELAALAAEAKRLATRARAAAMAVEVVIGTDVLQPGSSLYGYDRPATAREDFAAYAVSREWREAIERLATDATTTLPSPRTEGRHVEP